MKNIKFLFIILIFIFSCKSPKIIHINKNKIIQNELGNLYVLPKTSFYVEIEVVKTEYNKGPYSLYAQKYLGLTNIINSNSSIYKINNINLTTYPILDSSQFYLISNLHKAHKTLINLSKLNVILMSINDTNTNPQISTYLENSKIESVYPDIFKLYADNNLYERIDTIIEKIRIDTILVEKMIFKPSILEKTIEQKAKETADFITKIRENKYDVLRGSSEINYSKEAIEYMYSNLNELANEYIKLFTGITITKTFKYKYIIIPDSIDAKYIITNFSENIGMSDEKTDNSNEITLELSPVVSLSVLNNYYKSILNSKKIPKGIIIRKPLITNVSIHFKTVELYDKNIPINQFGVLMIEPFYSLRHNKK